MGYLLLQTAVEDMVHWEYSLIRTHRKNCFLELVPEIPVPLLNSWSAFPSQHGRFLMHCMYLSIQAAEKHTATSRPTTNNCKGLNSIFFQEINFWLHLTFVPLFSFHFSYVALIDLIFALNACLKDTLNPFLSKSEYN